MWRDFVELEHFGVLSVLEREIHCQFARETALERLR